ncbi:MAG: D-alanyl-D-alanine carboxypeptidase family protein [Streptosporangiaceae bacterium]
MSASVGLPGGKVSIGNIAVIRVDGIVMRAPVRLVLTMVVASCLGCGLLASPVSASASAVRVSAYRASTVHASAVRGSPVHASMTHAADRPSGIVAAGGDLVDVRTGRVLWSRGLRGERPIASLTKIMTAIVVIQAGHLNRKITVTLRALTYAQEYDATSAGLRPGDVLTAWQLLEGMLLPSGADAAYLLANAYGRGWRKFVRKMNATARKLGLAHTHFANFDGLPWPTEYSTYSTPQDAIRLGEAAMKLPAFRQIVRLHQTGVRATRWHQAYLWTNTDLLVGRYRGAIGIKTGFTHGAGYCLLFEAERGRRELMGVVLDSTSTDPASRFIAATRLLNWGFRS